MIEPVEFDFGPAFPPGREYTVYCEHCGQPVEEFQAEEGLCVECCESLGTLLEEILSEGLN